MNFLVSAAHGSDDRLENDQTFYKEWSSSWEYLISLVWYVGNQKGIRNFEYWVWRIYVNTMWITWTILWENKTFKNMFGLCNLVELFNCLISCKRVAYTVNVDELAQILAGRGCYII